MREYLPKTLVRFDGMCTRCAQRAHKRGEYQPKGKPIFKLEPEEYFEDDENELDE